MIFAIMIFVGVMVLGLICVGANCRKALREELDREHFSSIANACRLEFVFVRKEMEEVHTQVE